MTKIKQEVILELSNEELEEKLQEEKRLYQEKKFQHHISPLENPLLLRTIRRNIARMATEVNKRQGVETNEADDGKEY